MESMKELEAMLEASFRPVKKGDLVTGTVLQAAGDGVVVDIGSYMDGFVPLDQLLYDGEALKQYPAGSRLTLLVTQVGGKSDTILLSKIQADQITIWEDLQKKRDAQESIRVKVKAAVRGGLRIQYKSVQGFMPASQIDTRYVEDLEAYIGQELEAVILDIDAAKQEFTASRRNFLRAAEKMAKQRALQSLQPGDRLSGTVVKLEKYGAFIELEKGVVGLLHVSDMAWSRVKDPSQILAIGDTVTVAVVEVDKERGRIQLSLKAVQPDPWQALTVQEGQVLSACRVSHLIQSGAFIALTEEIEGFLPISRMSEKRIQTVREVLKEGNRVNVRVEKIDRELHQILLTMKEVPQGDEAELAEESEYQSEEGELTSSLGDALRQLKDFH